ncbi:MAG: hypothetical protein CM1200mP1_09290 [Candidatus Neomarinimicrobiota bacterium]|nr:MAG: hypothetical protein CM1200mP1_09290 [Candidatus Neomarinimicrobiota bacterium]
MREDANQRKIYYELRKELKKDRAKVAVSPISENFGFIRNDSTTNSFKSIGLNE